MKASWLVFLLCCVGCGGAVFSIAEPLDSAADTDGGAPACGMLGASCCKTGLACHASLSCDEGLDACGLMRAVDAGPPDAVSDDSASNLTCSTPTTPDMQWTNGIDHAGIKFYVTEDTTLTSFVFSAAGQQDSVVLGDGQCNLITSVSIPGVFPPNYAPVTVNVRWALKAGVEYTLTNTGAQTAYANGGTYPYTNGILVVEKGLITCPLNMNYAQNWTAFTKLTFCD